MSNIEVLDQPHLISDVIEQPPVDLLVRPQDDGVEVEVGDFTKLIKLSGLVGEYAIFLGRQPDASVEELEVVRELENQLVDDIVNTHEGVISPDTPYTYVVPEEELVIHALTAPTKLEPVNVSETDPRYEWLYDKSHPKPLANTARPPRKGFVMYRDELEPPMQPENN